MLRKSIIAFGLLLMSNLVFLSNKKMMTQIKEAVHSHSMWAGYHANHFAQRLGKDLEKLTRPFASNQTSSFLNITEKIKRSAHVLSMAPLSLFGIPLSLLFFSLATSTSDSRLEVIAPDDETPLPPQSKQLTLMSLNSCFQEGPFAPLTGGVASPFEPAGNHPTRIGAIADWVASSQLGPNQTSPDVLVGQEFHDLKAQDAFVEEMKNQGYRYFILDRAPHPLLNNSGLFVASKRELGQVTFIPFAIEDRAGLAKGTQQGALMFNILDDQKQPIVRIINTHLNYGDGPENQDARNRQLKKHILPLFSDVSTPSILVGDFNFDTSIPALKEAAGLKGYVNAVEGMATCTDEGKILLQGKEEPPTLEKIDALFANSHALRISWVQVEKLEVNGTLLTDHFSLSATIEA